MWNLDIQPSYASLDEPSHSTLPKPSPENTSPDYVPQMTVPSITNKQLLTYSFLIPVKCQDSG